PSGERMAPFLGVSLLGGASVPEQRRGTRPGWPRSLANPDLTYLSRSFLRVGFSGGAGLVQTRGAVDALPAAIGLLIPHQRIQDTQQPPSHGDVGLGPADACDQPLANRLLVGVALAEGDRGLAQRPAECGRAGFGDVATLPAAGRLLEVGRQSG